MCGAAGGVWPPRRSSGQRPGGDGVIPPMTEYDRPMLRARHLVRLGGEFVAYAVVNRVWWLIPLMLLLTLGTLLLS